MATAPNQPNVDPEEELVKVFESEQEAEALIVRGLLESAGIDAITQSIDADQDLFPIGGVAVLVRAEQADEARTLIEESRAKSAAAGEDEEGEWFDSGEEEEPSEEPSSER